MALKSLVRSIATMLLVLCASGAHAAAGAVRTVAEFPTTGPIDLPEGLAIDQRGTLYVGLLGSGRVIKIARDGTQSLLTQFDLGNRADEKPSAVLGLAMYRRDLYSVLLTHNRPGAPAHGVWRIRPDGSQELVAAFPDAAGEPNQIAIDRKGNIYVTDSSLGAVWRIERGGRSAVKWVEDSRLQPKSPSDNPCNVTTFAGGANGLAFGPRGDLYVASANRGSIVRIEIDRRSGKPTVRDHLQDCQRLTGLDHIAFDIRGNLYAARNVANELVRISPSKEIEVLASGGAGLHFPSNVVFGTAHRGRSALYFTNLGPAVEHRALKVLDVGVAGVPLQ